MTQHEHWHSSQTQVAWSCAALLSGRKISHRAEIREVRGWRLGAIIHRLRRHYGWPIVTEYRGPENVAFYHLDPACDHTKLRFPRSAKHLKPEVE